MKRGMTQRDAKRLALKFYKTCPITDKRAFDTVWFPLVEFARDNLVGAGIAATFKEACVTGRWNGVQLRAIAS